MYFVPAVVDVSVVVVDVDVAALVAGNVSLVSCASILQKTSAVSSHLAESAINPPPPSFHFVPSFGVIVMHSSSSRFIVLSVSTMEMSPVAGLV